MSDASASFILDIAAQMSGGAQTTAQLDTLTANLMGGGKSAEAFQQAIVQDSNALDAAKIASKAANDALGKGNEQYALLEKAALQAAKAEEKAALRGAVPPEVAATAVKASAAVNAYALTLRGLEHNAQAAANEETQLAKTLKNANTLAGHVAASTGEQERAVKKLKGALPALGGAFGQVGGQVAGAIDDFGDLTESFGGAGAAAILAVGATTLLAAAVAALTVALVVGVVKVASWAVGLADTARSAGLATEAFEIMNPQIEGLHDTIDELTNSTGLGEAAIDQIAKSLIAAKVSAKDLPSALEAAALAERALGTGGAQDFIAQITTGKKKVKEFSATVKDQLGGVVAQQMRGLDAQAKTFQTNVGRLFGGLDIEPVLRGLERLGALFTEDTAAGKAIKFLFESIFQPLIDQADKAATVIEAFALGFLIGLTKLYIALKPTIKAIAELFGQSDFTLKDTLDAVAKAGEYLAPVVAALVIGFGGAIAVAVALVGGLMALGAAFVYLPIAVGNAVASVASTFVQGIMSAIAFVQGIDIGQVGLDLITGLANGIMGGAAAVVKAITGAVGSAIDSAKALLGIHSPSTVFASIGDNTVAGFTGAVDDGATEAQSSLANMVSPALAKQEALSGNASSSSSAAAPAAKSANSNGGLAGATFNFYGLPDAAGALDKFGDMLTAYLEGDAAAIAGARVA
jgi:hypothetical protein